MYFQSFILSLAFSTQSRRLPVAKKNDGAQRRCRHILKACFFFALLSVLRVDIERSVFVIVRLTIVFPLPIRTNHLALPVNNMKGTITFDITLGGCFHQLSTCWKAMTGPFETSCYGAWMSKLESFHS